MQAHTRRGFTLIELLVVVSIIVLLIAILLPSLAKARRSSKLVVCMTSQRQIIIGVAAYSTENRGYYPPSNAALGNGWWSIPFWMNYHPSWAYAGTAASKNGHNIGRWLYSYTPSPDVFYCPLGPGTPGPLVDSTNNGIELDDAYRTGDTRLTGTSYFMLWNYSGYATQAPTAIDGSDPGLAPFVGPTRDLNVRDEANLLTCDVLEWQEPAGDLAWGSVHAEDGYPQLNRSESTWRIGDTTPETDYPDMQMNAGYTDGHVERYWSHDTVYAHPGVKGNHPARHYLPANAIR
ncbi:MAG: prepilin-type N-terminal cleavage/methylation domain-containing protein [Phycisphaera sp.]|nr:prepilin-type N-terminal cleavage/methylation domain-containing protein [Phycisphaera sp.]